ncbi:MAG: amino acid-binding protein [Lachnospiraceae bacterium]|nr:amino acid-binding protein [Lachnospiraceae bacterium]
MADGFVKQLTVFIENRVGTLEEVAKVLKDNEINIYSISLADTSEYGLLRMIVSDPDKGSKVLKENSFSAKATEVVAVRLENKVGTLEHLFNTLSGAGIGIEYMYAMATSKVGAMILKTSDGSKAVEVLKGDGFGLLDEAGMFNL